LSEAIYFEYDREKLFGLAHKRGPNTVQEYLEALVADDAEEAINIAEALGESLRDLKEGRTYPIEKLPEMLDDDTDTYFDINPEETFRQAWHEAMSGQTHPISILWDDADDE
jgi:hypothetical protein